MLRERVWDEQNLHELHGVGGHDELVVILVNEHLHVAIKLLNLRRELITFLQTRRGKKQIQPLEDPAVYEKVVHAHQDT